MFPVTISIHNAGQLNAVLRALQPHLAPSDFVDPAIAAVYAEVSQTVARQTLADIQAAAGATPLPPIEPPAVETTPAHQPQEAAAERVDPPAPAPTPAATAAGKPARGRRTAEVGAETAAPAKTAAASTPIAASAAAQPQASTAADVALDVPPLVSYEDVKGQILAVSRVKGRDAAVQLLGQFGAAKGPDLKPEQFGSFLEAARKVLA